MSAVTLSAQEGCTDPQALNFDAGATANDGSCLYPSTNYQMDNVAILPNALFENSGLALTSSGLWTHNDGGNADELYRIDSLSGAILQTILIANGENEDWEDLAEDEEHLYIGDFGNNNGNRMDLRIFRVPKSNLGNLITSAESIEFVYSDQTDFTIQPNNNDFDCEAFFYWQDSLHLFTKNWVDNQTRHYVLPASPGSHTAQLRETFDTEGLVTGADINENGIISLIGYTETGVNFMWILFDYQEGYVFSGNKRKINLGTGLTNSQTEAIVFRDEFTGYVSSENFNILPARLLRFSIQPWVDLPLNNSTVLNTALAFHIVPNPVVDQVNIQSSRPLFGQYQLVLINQNGQELGHWFWQASGTSTYQLNLNEINLASGQYLLGIRSEEGQYFERLVKLR
ncbi:MAG: T9SS type A sorting domain-containing protein [Bacteroidota bacterium]